MEFKSLTEGIDTTTPMGRIWFMLSAVFAENEREIIRERSKAGVEAVRTRGKIGVRLKGLSKTAKEKSLIVAILYNEGRIINQIRDILKIGSNSTIYGHL